MMDAPATAFPLAALAMGLVGSLHCVGMCGPIALALPRQGRGLHAAAMVAAHHLGRSLAYAAMGLLAGALGKGLSLAGLQQSLSIAMGILLFFFFVGQVVRWNIRLPETYARFIAKIKQGMSSRFNVGGLGSRLFFGILNGLLPCGLVYVALAGAAATGGVFHGAIFMLLFGFGTAPALLLLTLGGWKIGNMIRPILRYAIPAVTLLFALLLILRGLNLGIPYLSPSQFSEKMTEADHSGVQQKTHSGFSCCEGE